MLPRQQAMRFMRGRNSIASLLKGHSDFTGPRIACFPDSRPCGVCGAAPLAYMRLDSLNTFGLRKCFNYANWRLGCKLATGCELAFGLQIGVWAANWRLGCNWSSGKMAFEFVREQVIRTFRRRKSYASLTTGPAEFAGPHLDCVPANRLFGLFGAAHRMLPCYQPCGVCGAATRLRPCEQALRTLQGRTSHAYM